MSNSKLKQRIVTGSVLALLVIIAIFSLPIFEFTIIVALIATMAVWEWCRLINLQNSILRLGYILLTLVLFFICLRFFPQKILYLALIWWLISCVFILFYPRLQKIWRHSLVLAAVGILIIVAFAIAIIDLRILGPGYLLWGLFLVWGADTGAFAIGRRYGKHKLAAHVSPNKTIEGFLGGLALTIIFAVIGGLLLNVPSRHWLAFLLLAVVVNIAAVIGDLFESMTKRSANLKDSGNWLPGHGGLLDRIDSLMCALPIFSVGLMLIF